MGQGGVWRGLLKEEEQKEEFVREFSVKKNTTKTQILTRIYIIAITQIEKCFFFPLEMYTVILKLKKKTCFLFSGDVHCITIFQEMYSKIETNDEGDISMRNVVTHIQI